MTKKRHVSRDQKKQMRAKRVEQELEEIEALKQRIEAEALPLDAKPDYLERDPAEFYPASSR